MKSLLRLLVTLSCSGNLLIYCVANQSFRRIMILKLCLCCHCQCRSICRCYCSTPSGDNLGAEVGSEANTTSLITIRMHTFRLRRAATTTAAVIVHNPQQPRITSNMMHSNSCRTSGPERTSRNNRRNEVII